MSVERIRTYPNPNGGFFDLTTPEGIKQYLVALHGSIQEEAVSRIEDFEQALILPSDHGGLSGLTDDDHTQYIKDSEFTQNSGVLVGTGTGTFAEETGNTLRTSLGLAIGTDVQAWDADLDTYAGITPSADIQTFLANADFAAMMADLSGTAGAGFSFNMNPINDIQWIKGCSDHNLNIYSNLLITDATERDMIFWTLDATGDAWIEVFRCDANSTTPVLKMAKGLDLNSQSVTNSSGIDHGGIGGLAGDDHPQYIKDAEFTQDSGVLVGTGSGTFDEETGATLKTSIGFQEVYCSDYASFSDAIDAISTDEKTLLIAEQEAVTDDKTVLATTSLRFVRGGSLNISNTKTVTINGSVDAGRFVIFEGAGTVAGLEFINQLWFGITDAALVMAVRSLAAGVVWYLPNHDANYTQTTKITLPNGVKMYGDGMVNGTTIGTAVSGDVAIETAATGGGVGFETEIRDLQLLADSEAAVPSSGTCGIKLPSTHYVKVKRVLCEGFCTTGWGSAGTAGQVLSGFWCSGTVGNVFDACFARRNDIGFRVDEGGASVNTTTTYNNCTSQLNRTHGVKWENTMTTHWTGGVIESNNGPITVQITCDTTGEDIGNSMRDVHFESNCRLSGSLGGEPEVWTPDAGTRNINVDLEDLGGIRVENILFGAGSTYPETIVELTDTLKSYISGCFFSLGAQGTDTLEINASCTDTVSIASYYSTAATDNGTNSTFL